MKPPASWTLGSCLLYGTAAFAFGFILACEWASWSPMT